MRSQKHPAATLPCPIVNWGAVRVLALAVGVRKAARRLGISEEATMKRSQREKWLRDPEARAANARLTSQRQSEAASQRLTVSATCPQISPADAMVGEIAELNGQTRLSHARAQAKVAAHVETLTGSAILDEAQKVKATAQTADMVFGWKDTAPQFKIRLDVLNGSTEAAPIDIAADVIDGVNDWAESDPLDEY